MADFDWNHVRAFLAVARCGRLTTAAAREQTDHTTMSRRITCLGHALGAKLFNRSPTGYTLTEQGLRMLPVADQMEVLASSANELVRDSARTAEGTVRIGAPEGFGSYFLAERLGKIAECYPALDIQILASPSVYSLAKRDADIVISVTRPTEGRLIVSKLTDYSLGLYASGAYLARHPEIKDCTDLADHRFVGYIGDLLQTPELDYLKAIHPDARTGVQSSNLVAQLKATVGGAGLCVLPSFIARGEPELAPVLPDAVQLRRSLWLIIHADQMELARIKATGRFIRAEVAAASHLFLADIARVGQAIPSSLSRGGSPPAASLQ
jgi:DNA-binding transcriptional LysR family regulator